MALMFWSSADLTGNQTIALWHALTPCFGAVPI